MSASATIRALVVLALSLIFLYLGIFNPQLLNQGATSPSTVSEGSSRLFALGMGVGGVLFSLWIIRRQLRNAPPFSGFGTSGKLLLGFAGVAALAAVGYGFWYNAHRTYVSPTRHGQPAIPANAADAGPAPAPAPLPPAGASGDEPASVPGPLPAAVPQASEPASAPAPLPPSGE